MKRSLAWDARVFCECLASVASRTWRTAGRPRRRRRTRAGTGASSRRTTRSRRGPRGPTRTPRRSSRPTPRGAFRTAPDARAARATTAPPRRGGRDFVTQPVGAQPVGEPCLGVDAHAPVRLAREAPLLNTRHGGCERKYRATFDTRTSGFSETEIGPSVTRDKKLHNALKPIQTLNPPPRRRGGWRRRWRRASRASPRARASTPRARLRRGSPSARARAAREISRRRVTP